MNSNKKFVIMLEVLVITFFVMSVVSVCGLSDSSADISAYPSIVNPGDEITVTFSGAPGFESDFIVMYKVGDLDEGGYYGWQYLEGKKSGTLIFTAPYEPGDYVFQLFESVEFTDIAISNIVTVQEGTTVSTPTPTISATPSIANPGDEITVTFSGAPGFELGWIAMYKVGDPNEEEYDRGYYLAGKKSGTLIFTAPDEPGDYEFRLFEDDGYTDIAQSNIVTVQEGTTVSTPTPTPTTPSEGGLVGCWNLNEGSGNIACDRSGSGNDGTIHGATWVDNGSCEKALSFDGVDDYVETDPATFQSNDITVEAWIYPKSFSSYKCIVHKGDRIGANNLLFALLLNSNKISFYISSNGNNWDRIVGTTILELNKWYHVVGVYRSSDKFYAVYVNGTEDNSKTSTLSSLYHDASKSKYWIGARYDNRQFVSGRYFNGIIDEVRIYNRVLSEEEIQADMDKCAPMPTSIDHAEAPVTVLTSSTISPTAGGLLKVECEDNEQDGASLDIPAHAVSEEVTISIAAMEDLPSDSPFGQFPVGKLFVLEPSELTFDESVTLTLPIPPGEETRNLYVGVWNDKTKQWDNLGGTIDGDFISVEIYHLSFYGVFYSGKSTVRIVNEQQLDETDLPITVTYVAGPVPPIEIEDGSLVLACRPFPSGGVQLKRDEFRIMELLPGRYHFVVSYPRPQPGVANSMWFTIPELQVGADDGLVDQTITIRDDGAGSTDLFTALSINFPGRNIEPDTNFRPTLHIGADVPAGVNQAVLPVSQLETGTVQQLLIGPIKADQLHREGITLSATVEDPEGSTLKYIWSVDGDPLSGIRTVNAGTAASGSRLTFDFSRSRAGTYTVYLTVYDDRGLFNEGRWTIVVIPNAKPYIDVVVDDRVVDFGRLDGQRRNNPMIPLWLGGIVVTIPPGRPNNHTQPFPADDVRLPLRLWRPIPNWGVYVTPPVLPAPPGVVSSTELKRIVPAGVVPNNPTQYPQGMTCVYAIVADADADLIDTKFVLPTPIFFRGNFYTAIPLPYYPIGTLIDSYGVMVNYNAMLTEYANRGWLPCQPHNRSAGSPPRLAPFVAPTGPDQWTPTGVEPKITIVFPTPTRGEFPYVIAFNQKGILNGSINPGDIVTEAPNPLGLIPQGTVYKVIVVEGSWDQGNAKGYLWMIPVTDDFWDLRHAPPLRVPTLFVNGVQKAICSYVGQTLPVIWEAPDDPDAGGQVRDRRIIDPDTIPLGGMLNIEARVRDSVGTQQRAFAWVAWPTPPEAEKEADLKITKKDSPDPVLAGDNITYTLTVTNNGPSNATEVVVTDTLPSDVTFVSATPSQGRATESAGVVTWNVGDLVSGASVTLTIVVTVPSSAADDSTLTNTASVSAVETDPNTGDNSDTETTTVKESTTVDETTTVNKEEEGWVVWYAEKIGYQPIYVSTKSWYEGEALSYLFPGGGIDPSVILEKTFVMGPYSSEEEATKAICSQLTNFRRLSGIYAGLPVADYGGKIHNIGNIDCGPEYWKSP